MRKYLDLTSWILLFFFAPFTVLILLSQNTVPGDFFYPVKRGLENIILVAASVSPNSKVAFRTDLTQRRFSEAQELLVSKADTTAYNGFIDEVSATSQDLSKLSNTKDKVQSSDKLLAKIEEYQIQLNQAQNQVQIAQGLPSGGAGSSSAGQNQLAQSPQPFQTSAPVPSSQPAVQPTPSQPNPTVQQVQTPTPNQPGQTSQPVQQPVQNQPIAAPTPATPANVPTPQPLAPQVTNTIANNPQKAEEVKEKIKNTKEHLEKIKEKVKKDKEDAEVQEKVKEEQKKLREELNKKNEPTPSPANH